MSDIVIDSNIVIWYFGELSRLTNRAETTVDAAVDTGTVLVPSIVILELVYLIERKRVPSNMLAKLREALDLEPTTFRLVELTRHIADELANIDRSLVADMPDRIVAATALHLDLPLVTSDEDIQKLTNVRTIW